MGKHSCRFIVAIFVFIMIAGATDAAGQGHPSARVRALGGEAVSGIVRDTLTDIYLSPAFLASCDRLTINYGQRYSPELYLGFPSLNQTGYSRWYNNEPRHYTYIESDRSNEVALYGIGLGGWKFAASTEWRLDHSENSHPDYSSLDLNIPDIDQSSRHRSSKGSDRYVRADLSAARKLSGDYKLGIRIGGMTSKLEKSNTTVENYYDFEVYEDPYGLVPEYRRYNYSVGGEAKRFSGAFAQVGLLRDSLEKLRSIDLRISRNEIYIRSSNQTVSSRTYYNLWGDPDEYVRNEKKWRDERSGTMWRYDLFGRLSSASGLRVFGGIGFEHMNYETSWSDLVHNYGWSDNGYFDYTEMDVRTTIGFEDDGDYNGINAFVKAGKAKRLRDDLEITAGLHAWMKKRWSEEKPVAHITFHSLIDGSLITFSLDNPLEISTDRTDAGLDIPIAIDFEPAHWISIWSGFRIFATYKKLDDEAPEIIACFLENFDSYVDLENYTLAYNAYRLDDLYVGSTATVGVSLHYKDRFFVDLYTGSDVTPDYLTSYILDVRYVF